jgi:hypothetical protein
MRAHWKGWVFFQGTIGQRRDLTRSSTGDSLQRCRFKDGSVHEIKGQWHVVSPDHVFLSRFEDCAGVFSSGSTRTEPKGAGLIVERSSPLVIVLNPHIVGVFYKKTALRQERRFSPEEEMMPPDDAGKREDLLETYLAYTKALEQGTEDDARFWAVEAMWELVDRDPEGAWTILLQMIDRADGDYALASIAAGPLENFIVAHGERFLGRIEAEARTTSKFRRALVGVWGQNRMPDELVRRLRALTAGEPPL